MNNKKVWYILLACILIIVMYCMVGTRSTVNNLADAVWRANSQNERSK